MREPSQPPSSRSPAPPPLSPCDQILRRCSQQSHGIPRRAEHDGRGAKERELVLLVIEVESGTNLVFKGFMMIMIYQNKDGESNKS